MQRRETAGPRHPSRRETRKSAPAPSSTPGHAARARSQGPLQLAEVDLAPSRPHRAATRKPAIARSDSIDEERLARSSACYRSSGELPRHTDELQAYLEGRATPDERRRLQAHLDGCAHCRQLVLAISENDTAAAPTPSAAHAGRGRADGGAAGRGAS